MDVVDQNIGSNVDSNVAVAMVIEEYSSLVNKETPPRTPPPRKASLSDWAATPSTGSPGSPPLNESSKSSIKTVKDMAKIISGSNKLFNSLEVGESRSVFEEDNSSKDESAVKLNYLKFKNKKVKYPKTKFSRTGNLEFREILKTLNNWIIYFGLFGSNSIFGSDSKRDIICKMQKEKKLKNCRPKVIDITDGKLKNMYSQQEFVYILNYIIREKEIQNIDYNCFDKKKDIVVEENHLYFDNSEEILNRKLTELNVGGQLKF